MQTSIPRELLQTAEGQEADAILRSCVHCGFCLATCPTYRLLGNELDSPRGRIYLIKRVLEGSEPTADIQLHLDRCLTCRNCETTCPSGVRYGRLLDIGRHAVDARSVRPWPERMVRWSLRAVLPRRSIFGALLRLGRLARPLAPRPLARLVPVRRPPGPAVRARHRRQVLVPEGCVQPALAPRINAATARVLDRLGIGVVGVRNDGCCGALSYHLNAHEEAKRQMRRNIDAWWPHLEAGAQAIVSTASGCGVMMKQYGQVLREDPTYAEKAERVSAMTLDLSQLLAREELGGLGPGSARCRVAFHPPCTLQHGQQIRGVVEGILRTAGYELVSVPDAHLCCGSAGTYSLLQRRLSQRLLREKIAALTSGDPELLVTANIGCQLQLQGATSIPVRHWVELLDAAAD